MSSSMDQGILDVDYALDSEKFDEPTDETNDEDRAFYDVWKRSKKLCFEFMRMTIARNITTLLPKSDSAKEFLKAMEKRFKTADKSIVGTLMAQLTTMKYNRVHGMQNHIMEMTNLAAKLKTLGMIVGESFLVQFILNSLHAQYGPFQIHY
ncbi:hypothetical protein QYF36_020442 [Acer negundo]|nr:hypothetical protein QYF36_020442 [Acer negundo]